MVSKICAFPKASCSSSGNICPIEKTTEENKEKEEAFDKAKKKLILYETSVTDHERSVLADKLQAYAPHYQPRSVIFPAKNVPTPPPDRLV